MTTDKFMKDAYYEYYMSLDKEGKRLLTNKVNLLLETIPPKTIAMAVVAITHATLDRNEDELNPPD